MVDNIKAIFFDMHGVIMVDPDEKLPLFLKDYAKEKNMEMCVRVWLDASIGKITSQEMLIALGVGDGPEHLQQLERDLMDSIEINPDFYAAADQLKKRFRLGLLSNDTAEWSAYLREKFRLNPYFDPIVVSGDVGMRKPDPDIFRYALDQARLSAGECLFIDDRVRNLKAAAQLGMRTFLFQNTALNGAAAPPPSIWNEDDAGDSALSMAGSFAELVRLLS